MRCFYTRQIIQVSRVLSPRSLLVGTHVPVTSLARLEYKGSNSIKHEYSQTLRAGFVKTRCSIAAGSDVFKPATQPVALLMCRLAVGSDALGKAPVGNDALGRGPVSNDALWECPNGSGAHGKAPVGNDDHEEARDGSDTLEKGPVGNDALGQGLS